MKTVSRSLLADRRILMERVGKSPSHSLGSNFEIAFTLIAR